MRRHRDAIAAALIGFMVTAAFQMPAVLAAQTQAPPSANATAPA